MSNQSTKQPDKTPEHPKGPKEVQNPKDDDYHQKSEKGGTTREKR